MSVTHSKQTKYINAHILLNIPPELRKSLAYLDEILGLHTHMASLSYGIITKGLHTLHTSSFDLLFLEQITQLLCIGVSEAFAVYAGLKSKGRLYRLRSPVVYLAESEYEKLQLNESGHFYQPAYCHPIWWIATIAMVAPFCTSPLYSTVQFTYVLS